ncbi:MAG: lipid A deacylase LpxR family protein [Bacteroidia bacterium]|nr:lipid A deacylase LpxR family protein [Bacteroidia bacterium]
MRVLMLALLFFWLFCPVCGQDANTISSMQDSLDQHVRPAFWIDFEQDFLLDFLPGINQDRNYTQGTAFSFESPQLRNNLLFIPLELLSRLQNKLSKTNNHLVLPSVLSFGITAFTPRVIDAPGPVIGDRPFANLVWLSTVRNTINIHTGWYTQTGLHFGWLGSNTANVFQSFAHRSLIKGRPTDISWEHQISRGGAPAFLFSLRSMRSLWQFPNDSGSTWRWFDLSAGGHIQAGWYTGIGLPVQIKAGKISLNSLMSNDLSAILSNGNRLLRKAEGRPEPSNPSKHTPSNNKSFFEAYLFISAEPRITPHNSMLLGQPGKKDTYVLPDENYNPLLLDIEYGIVLSKLHIRDQTLLPVKRFDVILSMQTRSPEIINTTYQRWHHWGRVGVRCSL